MKRLLWFCIFLNSFEVGDSCMAMVPSTTTTVAVATTTPSTATTTTAAVTTTTAKGTGCGSCTLGQVILTPANPDYCDGTPDCVMQIQATSAMGMMTADGCVTIDVTCMGGAGTIALLNFNNIGLGGDALGESVQTINLVCNAMGTFNLPGTTMPDITSAECFVG